MPIRSSLLIVRDLLLGPRRFTDLTRSLTAITPTRLTLRLRQLEAAGIVTREPLAAGREVWYELTESGRDLGPAVETLTLWGIEHAREPPRRGEAVHPDPVMIGSKVWLTRHASAPGRSVAWVWRFGADDYYTLRFDQGTWALARGQPATAAVTVETTPEAWARFLTASQGARQLPRDDIDIAADRAALEEFAHAFRAGLGPPEDHVAAARTS